MTHIVVVAQESDGSIKLTKDELQKMLDDAYRRGLADGNSSTTISYPSYPTWICTNAGASTDKVQI